MIMVVALVANQNWYRHLVIEVYSLLKTTKTVKKVYLFTETDNADEIPHLRDVMERFNDVEIIVKDSRKIMDENINSDSLNRNSFYTDFCMVKLMFQNILEEDKIFYIDSDAIVLQDISNIWKYNIDDYYVAGVRDFGIMSRGTDYTRPIEDKYINSGVVLFNLKKMREDKIQEKMFEMINSRELSYPDQDALNLVCYDKIYLLPIFYNQCSEVTLGLIDKSKTRIMHYAGIKDQFWVTNRYHSEYWYEIEEEFNNEFGWD